MSNFRKAGIVCLSMGAVLMISALLLFMYNQAEDRRAGEASAAAVTELQTLLEKRTEAETREEEAETNIPEETKGLEETEKSAETEAEEVPAGEEAPRMTVEEIGGYGYIGILELPTLGLELPVMEECTDGNLKKAPCLYHGSAAEGNLVIAGHNYRQHFGYLPDVEIGDTITFTDMDGVVYTYEVGAVETLAATAVKEMNESEWELSLYTCTYSGNERITVRCRRVEMPV